MTDIVLFFATRSLSQDVQYVVHQYLGEISHMGWGKDRREARFLTLSKRAHFSLVSIASDFPRTSL